jgi:hypothetical protein
VSALGPRSVGLRFGSTHRQQRHQS